jgi:hypothetical protein
MPSGWNMEFSWKWPSEYLDTGVVQQAEQASDPAYDALLDSLDRFKAENPTHVHTWMYALPMKASSIHFRRIETLPLGGRYLLVMFEADGARRKQEIADPGLATNNNNRTNNRGANNATTR